MENRSIQGRGGEEFYKKSFSNLSSEEIEKRMADDKKIWDQYKDNYDYVMGNVPGKLEKTIAKIVNIVENPKL